MRSLYAVTALLAALCLTACQSMQQGKASAVDAVCTPYDHAQLAGMGSEAQITWLTQRIDQCKLDNTARANDFYNRGAAQLELNRFQLAAADADATLALVPQDSRAFALRCLARMGLSENEGATA